MRVLLLGSSLCVAMVRCCVHGSANMHDSLFERRGLDLLVQIIIYMRVEGWGSGFVSKQSIWYAQVGAWVHVPKVQVKLIQ